MAKKLLPSNTDNPGKPPSFTYSNLKEISEGNGISGKPVYLVKDGKKVRPRKKRKVSKKAA